MITLYQFAPAFGLPNPSPFCLKLETYLRMCQLPYQVGPTGLRTLRQAPKGKLPYIRDEGQLLSDSTFIIDYLKTRYGDVLDHWQGAQQRAVALAFQRLFEENLYWVSVYLRWFDPQSWDTTRHALFSNLPQPLRSLLPPLARRGIRQELIGHGIGRHNASELIAIGQRDLTAIADFLGDKPFMLGERASSLDACAYGFLANLLWVPYDNALKQHALSHPQLLHYCARMRDRYWA